MGLRVVRFWGKAVYVCVSVCVCADWFCETKKKIVDYTQYASVEDHLAERFGDDPFDVIFECTDSRNTLFARADEYLKPDGRFVSVIGGWSQGVVPFLVNKLRPVVLGGTPRSYDIFLLTASGVIAKHVGQYVEEGIIKDVPIDSEFPMEQAVEVNYCSVPYLNHWALITIC